MFDLAEPEAYFARYAPLIGDLPDPLERETLCSERFLLHQDGRLRICYVPFDHVNVDARATIVGVTPGWLQMEIGYRVARDQLRAGAPTEVALAEVKKAAAFAGTMRRNLLSMLDEIGLPEALGIASSSCLFDTRADLLHSTSAVRYPVFVDGENYTGSHPALLKTKALRDFVERCLAPELQVVAAALIIPLGSVVERCLRLLVNQGVLDLKRCLFGFPHPSGANGHRRRQFDERRDDLQRTVRDWFRPHVSARAGAETVAHGRRSAGLTTGDRRRRPRTPTRHVRQNFRPERQHRTPPLGANQPAQIGHGGAR